MTKPEVFISGASGEIGYGLINFLNARGDVSIIAMDLREPPPNLKSKCTRFYVGDIRSQELIRVITENHDFSQVFHLAGLLSSTGEKNPLLAHEVNVNGSYNIIKMVQDQNQRRDALVTLVFTSSIAVYGIRETDDVTVPVQERQFLTPKTMYGVNKLYVEALGRYFSRYSQGMPDQVHTPFDFRCLRFPGLISSETLPTGGTTDYGPEMLHAAARGEPYSCFVKRDTRLPFMLMEDAIRALIMLAEADKNVLQHNIYNVTSFSVTARQIEERVALYFPDAQITFDPVPHRQFIVDSWPRLIDDSWARADWNWSPEYGFEEAFDQVLVPRIKARYQSKDANR